MLTEQNRERSEINVGKKDRIKLVIASSNSAKPFEFLEKALYDMTIFVDVPVAEPRNARTFAGRNGIISIILLEIIQNDVCTISSISKDMAIFQIQARQ